MSPKEIKESVFDRYIRQKALDVEIREHEYATSPGYSVCYQSHMSSDDKLYFSMWPESESHEKSVALTVGRGGEVNVVSSGEFDDHIERIIAGLRKVLGMELNHEV